MERKLFPLQTLREAAPNSFIYEQHHALDPQFCAALIERFESCPEQQYPGRIGQDAQANVAVKRSTDMVISGKSEWADADRFLFRSLGRAIRELRERVAFFQGPFKDMGYAVQRTRPGEFYHWHIDGGSHEFSQRQLVAVWYLNDVPGPGGTTDFLYQQVKIRPEAGKLVLFPPFWTHEHRGATLHVGVKYIATTWVVFA